MRWPDRDDERPDPVLGMLDDLELQAEGLHLAERAVEVDELSTAQYAEIVLVARLHASVGTTVRVGMSHGTELHGRLANWIFTFGAPTEEDVIWYNLRFSVI